MSNSLGLISSVEIKNEIESEIFFPKNMMGLKWTGIKKLSVLTGKNGIGKSKVLKLIIAWFKNKEFRDTIISINDGNYKDFIVNLIHFDSNLTNLKNDVFYENSHDNKFFESNFTIENCFRHLRKDLIYSFTSLDSSRSNYDLTSINDMLCSIINDDTIFVKVNKQLKEFKCEFELKKEPEKILLIKKKDTLYFDRFEKLDSDTKKQFIDSILEIMGDQDEVNIIAKLNSQSKVDKMKKLIESSTNLNFDLQSDYKLSNSSDGKFETKGFDYLKNLYMCIENHKDLKELISKKFVIKDPRIIAQIERDVLDMNKLIEKFKYTDFKLELFNKSEIKFVVRTNVDEKLPINDINDEQRENLFKFIILLKLFDLNDQEKVENVNRIKKKYGLEGELKLKQKDEWVYVKHETRDGVKHEQEKGIHETRDEIINILIITHIHEKLNKKLLEENEKLKSYELSIESENEILFVFDDTLDTNQDTKKYKKIENLDKNICNEFKKLLSLCDDKIELSEYEITHKIEDKLKDLNQEFLLKKQVYFYNKFTPDYFISNENEIDKCGSNFNFNGKKMQPDEISKIKPYIEWVHSKNFKINVNLEEIIEQLCDKVGNNYKKLETFQECKNELVKLCEILHLKSEVLQIDGKNLSVDINEIIKRDQGFMKLYGKSITIDKSFVKIKELCRLKQLFDKRKLFIESGSNKNDSNFLNCLKEEIINKLGKSEFDKYEKKCSIPEEVKIEKETLFKNKTHDTIKLKLTELTTGEKIIIITILWEIIVKRLETNQKLILMLDEPDCFLHPYAIEKFICKLKAITSESTNVQVIFTSHNPGTISLLEEENIFYLDEKSLENHKLKPCDKDGKLKILEGITDNLFFVMNPFNLVFVEGKYDYIFYTLLYKKFNKKQIPTIFRGMGSNQFMYFFKKDNNENIQIDEHVYGIIDGDNFIDEDLAIDFYRTNNIDPKHFIITDRNVRDKLNRVFNCIIKKVGKLKDSKTDKRDTLIELIKEQKEYFGGSSSTVTTTNDTSFSSKNERNNNESSQNTNAEFIKIQTYIQNIRSLYNDHLFRLKRRHIENYLYDPFNLFFLIEDINRKLSENKLENFSEFDQNSTLDKFLSKNGKKIIEKFQQLCKDKGLEHTGKSKELDFRIYTDNGNKDVKLSYDTSLLYSDFKKVGSDLCKHLKLNKFFINENNKEENEVYWNGKILEYLRNNESSHILFYNRALPYDLEHIKFFSSND